MTKAQVKSLKNKAQQAGFHRHSPLDEKLWRQPWTDTPGRYAHISAVLRQDGASTSVRQDRAEKILFDAEGKAASLQGMAKKLPLWKKALFFLGAVDGMYKTKKRQIAALALIAGTDKKRAKQALDRLVRCGYANKDCWENHQS